ncbi:MAG: GlsB/YeaQ/YmgE family stress response membrane protein [Chitinophagaceae bacterium]|nr:GlsB/YeaQ/YmgE family stress response membrane protein [Anaerolineae bacterium]
MAAFAILAVLAAIWFVTSIVGPILGLIFTVLSWIFIGFLAGKVLRGRGYGPVGDGLLGLGGGIVGSLLFGLLGIGSGGLFLGIVAGVVGAVVLVYLVRLVSDSNFAR